MPRLMKKEDVAMEKVYKTMVGAGTANIVLGIILIIVGVTAGVITLINGARLLNNKKEILF